MYRDIYNLLSEESRTKFDAVVLSLMLRGKTLKQSIDIAVYTFGRRLLKFDEGWSEPAKTEH